MDYATKELDPHTMYMSNLYWYEPYTASQSIQFESSLLDPVSKATGSVLNLYHIFNIRSLSNTKKKQKEIHSIYILTDVLNTYFV